MQLRQSNGGVCARACARAHSTSVFRSWLELGDSRLMIVEFLEITFSRHDTCNLLCDTSLAPARSSPTRRYTGIKLTRFNRICFANVLIVPTPRCCTV